MEQHTRDRGASAVEFALVAPLLVALLLGILAFGHAFHVQSMLSNAARDGVRVMALSGLQDVENPHGQAQQAAIASAAPSVALTEQHITVSPATCDPTDNASSEHATVTISYPLQLLGGIGNITLTGKGTMRCNG